MANLGLCIFVCFFSLASIAQLREPRVNYGDYRLELGTDVHLAIRLWNSSFKVLKEDDFSFFVRRIFSKRKLQKPMAAIGRFNSDNKKDVCLLGFIKGNLVAIMLVSDVRRQKYHVRVIQKVAREQVESLGGYWKTGERRLNIYLSLLTQSFIKKKKLMYLKSVGIRKKKILRIFPNEGVQLEYLGGSTKSYIYNGKKVVPSRRVIRILSNFSMGR